MKSVFCVLVFLALVFSTSSSFRANGEKSLLVHSGGTDKCGYHVKKATGEYHCHTRKQRGGDCPA